MKAMLSLLLEDLPGLPMTKRGNTALAAIPLIAVSKVLRFKKGVVRGAGIRFHCFNIVFIASARPLPMPPRIFDEPR